MLNRLPAVLLASAALSANAVTTFHVSPNGNDTNSGTRQQPFASVFRARDEIRKLREADRFPADGAVVEIAGGRYDLSETFELTSEDSGAPGAPVIYRCDPKARAWLVAGRDVPVSALKPLADANLLARIPEDARLHIRCLDLKEAGIQYYTRLPDRFNCWAYTTLYPEALGYKPEYGYTPGRWTPLEVFCDGRELTPARWPNRDYVRVDEIVDDGEGFARANVRGGTFAQPSLKEKLKLWAGAEELILNGYFFRDYFCYSVRVAKLDLAKSTVTLSNGLLDTKHKPHQRFYAHHLPEELDVPGEWFLNRATGLLCVWPPKGALTLTFPVLTDTILRLSGASHVTIRGLGLEGGRHHALEVNGGESNRVIACEVRNVGRDGVLVKGGRDHRVLGCDIKQGRRIVIDGAVNDEEWSPPGYDGSEPNRHRAATIEWLLTGDADPRPSTAYIETDASALFVAFVNEVDSTQAISQTHRWGQDDAVEVALAVTAPPEATPPGMERPFIFRGYPDGHFEGSMESGWMEQEVARAMQGVQFAANEDRGRQNVDSRVPNPLCELRLSTLRAETAPS